MLSKAISIVLSALSMLSFWVQSPAPGDAARAVSYGETKLDEEKYCGIRSCVQPYNGVPTLFVNGKPYPAAAYMTYLENYNRYAQFAAAEYTLFSVPTLFAGRWISVTEGLTPFGKGIFDDKGAPDFSVFDASIQKILTACPDAYIFPRVNVSMPEWWIRENADKLDGTGKRESLYTEQWRRDAAQMLRCFIDHVIHSAYASHIVGYQIAGGNTEEWFHFDMNAGLCPSAEQGFRAFLAAYYPDVEYKGLPDLSLLKRRGSRHGSAYLARYLEYASYAVADDIAFLAHEAKLSSGGQVVVGTFYGYDLEVTVPLHGTHALRCLLQCDDIDFLSSPNSYIGTRDEDADWTEMYPADSVRLHGKLCMQECDVRTHLTRPLGECAPETDPQNIMTAPIWHGLPDKQTAIAQIRKSFCRQLIKGNGFWWFDMWGGWYDDEDVMREMQSFRAVYEASMHSSRASLAQVAVFVDESAVKWMTDCGLRNAIYNQRKALGCMGAPYDLYDISDFDAVYSRYKAVLFFTGIRTENLSHAVGVCRKSRIPFLLNSDWKKDFTVRELRAFCESSGVHLYMTSDDVLYVNLGYLAIHATDAGEKTVTFPQNVRLRGVWDAREYAGTSVRIPMQDGETVLFAIE